MPIYEFYSPATHTVYSFFARSIALREAVPDCPDGKEHPMRRVASRFAFVGRAQEPAAGAPDGAAEDDPQFEAVMAEMERECGGMDVDNPDPRQLGRMMRKMAQLAGEKVPEAFDEMVARLEAGEDPELLEEEYAEAMEDDGLWGEDAGDDGGGTSSGRLGALARRRRPQRDPKLYEMRDYLPAEH